MGIRAVLTSGKEIEVPSYSLDYAISTKRIVAFLRADGWVNVDEHKLRKQQHASLCLLGHGDRDTDKLFIRSNE
jgi:hypothetical protein